MRRSEHFIVLEQTTSKRGGQRKARGVGRRSGWGLGLYWKAPRPPRVREEERGCEEHLVRKECS